MEVQAHLTSFSPQELAALVGLSPNGQRAWRHHGFLPRRERGWSRFTLIEISAIALRTAFVELELGPSAADLALQHEHGGAIVNSITFWALESDSDRWCPEDDTPPALRAWLTDRFGDSRFNTIRDLSGIDPALAFLFVGVHPSAKEIFVANEVEELGLDDRCPGLILISLHNIGRRISARAPRPLLQITSGADSLVDLDKEQVRCLENMTRSRQASRRED